MTLRRAQKIFMLENIKLCWYTIIMKCTEKLKTDKNYSKQFPSLNNHKNEQAG